jgi:hypothetical protein
LKAGSRGESTAIQHLIERTRFRIRTQWALEGATTATVLAAATALVAVFAMRAELVGKATGIYLLIAAGAIILIGAVASALRPLDDEAVARRIDRASNLSDRLSTAIAFRRTLETAGAAPALDSSAAGADGSSRSAELGDEHTDLMLAAIRDGERAVPRANIRAAAPFVAPRDWRAALGFLAVSALAAGLAIPTVDRTPHLTAVQPSKARPGEEVSLIGDHLLSGVATPLASMPAGTVLGAPDVPAVGDRAQGDARRADGPRRLHRPVGEPVRARARDARARRGIRQEPGDEGAGRRDGQGRPRPRHRRGAAARARARHRAPQAARRVHAARHPAVQQPAGRGARVVG